MSTISNTIAQGITLATTGSGTVVNSGTILSRGSASYTVTQANSPEAVEYVHIEFETHEIVFAEEAPAESYVDCDNRLMFANAAECAQLYPEDDRPRGVHCAPRLEWHSPELAGIRARLQERAAALHFPILDSDPDLIVVAGGKPLRPYSAAGRAYRFELPAGARDVWLVSRSTVPAQSLPGARDSRRLGVPIRRIALYDADLSLEAWHAHPALTEGFHEDEAGYRWTDGRARVPEVLLRPFAGVLTLEVRLAAAGELRHAAPPAGDASGQAAGDAAGEAADDAAGDVAGNAATGGLALRGATLGVLGQGGAFPPGCGLWDEAGLGCEIAAAGEEDGTPFIDVRLFGTPKEAAATQLFLSDPRALPVAPDQRWALSVAIASPGTAPAGLSLQLGANLIDAAGCFSSWFGSRRIAPEQLEAGGRRTLSGRIKDPAAAYLQPLLQIAAPPAAPLDLTLRIAGPRAQRLIEASQPVAGAA